jgi:hypothetical protein
VDDQAWPLKQVADELGIHVRPLAAGSTAMASGPRPIRQPEVYRLHGHYYVSDGHHRVAAARALGERSMAAYVTEIVPVP